MGRSRTSSRSLSYSPERRKKSASREKHKKKHERKDHTKDKRKRSRSKRSSPSKDKKRKHDKKRISKSRSRDAHRKRYDKDEKIDLKKQIKIKDSKDEKTLPKENNSKIENNEVVVVALNNNEVNTADNQKPLVIIENKPIEEISMIEAEKKPDNEAMNIPNSVDNINEEEKNGSIEPMNQEKEKVNEIPEEMDEESMMKMMGFGTFVSSKGKAHVDSAEESVLKNSAVKRKYRQYMNRRGGFNRALDKMT